jgi:DNA polymerase I-like protein with 3'-5' exonuclease and polymerase domains
MEARIGADVYNEHKLLDEFLYGSGDTHAAYAKAVFVDELKNIETKDVKKLRPDLRSKVKSIEFAVQFGSDGTAVAPQLKISVEEARQLVINLLNGMTGLKSFKEKWSKFVLDNGYMPILPDTGHRGYWHDWGHWKEVQASYTKEFWDNYKQFHKGTGDDECKEVKQHFQAKSKWCDRMSLNLPTQGGGAVVLKEAATALYKWVIDNGYWGKILFVNFTHDEINSEFPEELKDIYPNVVAQLMKDAAAKYYHKLPIPAEAEVAPYWKH